MRKWMRDRLKRGKKKTEEKAPEKASAPAPLQPRFYDDNSGRTGVEQVQAEAAAVETEPPAEATPEAAEPEPEGAESGQRPGQPPSTDRPARRRRRGRGRRGGSAGAKAAKKTAPVSEPEAVESEAAAAPVAVEPGPEVPVPEESVPDAPIPTPPAGTSKGTVVLAIGLPGSGKSSWFKRHNIHPLSSDLLRELLFDNAQEQRFQDLVFSNLRSMLKARLIARRPLNYVDATNLTPHDRHSWIRLAKDYGYDVHGVFFDVPLDVCLERNQRRNRVVDEDVMRRMAGKMKAPSFDEGFSKITVVRVKAKAGA